MHKNLKCNVKPIHSSVLLNNHPPRPTHYHRVSRLASKKTLSGEEDHETLVGAFQEASIEEMTNVAAREFLPAHPVKWDGRNLCEMVSDSKLDKLSLAQLKDICASLNIDTDEIRVKRKQPYVEKVDAYCQTCICKLTK